MSRDETTRTMRHHVFWWLTAAAVNGLGIWSHQFPVMWFGATISGVIAGGEFIDWLRER